jgi:hypothetical protein
MSTSFWHDQWLSTGRFNAVFPLLYTHATDGEVTVAQVVQEDLTTFPVPRITQGTTEELVKMQELLRCVSLRDGPDRRHCPLAGKDNVLRSGVSYPTLVAATGPPICTFHGFVWGNRAPLRVQFFAWLLVQERIQCHVNLVCKHVLDDDAREICGLREDNDHIVFCFPFAAHVWAKLGVETTTVSVRSPWLVPCPASIPKQCNNCFLLLICWMLWKHRNDVVFSVASPSQDRFWASCRSEARLWCYRLPREDRVVVDAWCLALSPM